jgi:hypothetical protein
MSNGNSTWNNYSEFYNLLSDKMQEMGIDISLLDDVIAAHEKVVKGETPTVLSTHLSNNNPQNNLERKFKVVK